MTDIPAGAGEPPVKAIRKRRHHIAELALELLAFDTSNPPGETRESIEWIEQYCQSYGLETEQVVADPAKPNLIVTVPGESDRTVWLLGHVDTVPFNRTEWTYDPLGEHVGNRLYGRGATDMKGPAAAMIETICQFAETGATPPVTLALVLVSDEEVAGDAGLPAMLERLPPRTVDTVEACVIGETTCQYGNHSITVADRGSIWLTLSAEGTAAHGSRPVLGENAIDRLYRAVQTIREELGTRRLDLPVAVEPIIEESIKYYEPVMDAETGRRLFEYPTVNLGIFDGGESINSVPTTARARIDIRLSPGVETSVLLGDIEHCISNYQGIELVDVSWSVGTYEAPDSPLVDALADVASEVTGDRIYRRSATGGGDAKKLRNAGIPTVEFALGTDTVHAVDEYTTVEAIAANGEIYARFPYEFANRTHSEA